MKIKMEFMAAAALLLPLLASAPVFAQAF